MAIVVMSYRQNVHAYPSGGGDYEVATVNLGPTAGLTVGSALLVDYVLTVAVSISSGVQNAELRAAVARRARGHRGVRAGVRADGDESPRHQGVRQGVRRADLSVHDRDHPDGRCGATRATSSGDLPDADSAQYHITAEGNAANGLTGLAMVFLLARAFSSGCAALTGVEAISNGVPAFKKPKSKNAATTLLLLGTIAITMLMSIVVLADLMKLQVCRGPRAPAAQGQRQAGRLRL